MGTTAYVEKLPPCNFCGVKAEYDFKTKQGQWVMGCLDHWVEHRAYSTLGTGKGQHWIEGEAPDRTDEDIKKEAYEAILANDFDAFEEAIGDRDPAEFL